MVVFNNRIWAHILPNEACIHQLFWTNVQNWLVPVMFGSPKLLPSSFAASGQLEHELLKSVLV